MIYRRNYRAALLPDGSDNKYIPDALVMDALSCDADNVDNLIKEGRCLHLAMYRHENMLFLYLEASDEDLSAEDLFPELSRLLADWPEHDGPKKWIHMYTIYYHAIPGDEAEWFAGRENEKIRRGRIAYLKRDKLFSYVYYHKAIVDEGLLEGDRFQFIALHEDVLFSYFEEPKEFAHLSSENKESSVINEWLAKDPESHFDREMAKGSNFLMLPMIFTASKKLAKR